MLFEHRVICPNVKDADAMHGSLYLAFNFHQLCVYAKIGICIFIWVIKPKYDESDKLTFLHLSVTSFR